MSKISRLVKVMRRGPTVPVPYRIAMAHKPTLIGKLNMERWISFSGSVPEELKSLAQLRAASMIGCVW